MSYGQFPNRELAAYAGFICRSIDRIVVCLNGLDEGQLNWRPPGPQTNSLYLLAIHTMANAEENILGTLCGQPIERRRGDEFAVWGTAAADAEARWRDLRERLTAALGTLDPTELEREREHPRRGSLTGREVLLVVARHAAEHQGHAELTRDLLRATLSGKSRG
jgi:hypothetical protein